MNHIHQQIYVHMIEESDVGRGPVIDRRWGTLAAICAALSYATATQIVQSGWVDLEQFFRAVYDRFNARDVDALLVDMTSDVDWPDVRGGRRIAGHEAVRAYWADQWRAIDPHVTPRHVIELPDGRVDVEVHQVIHDRATGDVLVDQVVHHIYELRDGAVAAMHVTSTAAERSSRRDEAPERSSREGPGTASA